VQHVKSPAAAQTPRAMAEHHAFLEAERAAIENGEGFGMALAADKNGYPGPKHVLDMKKELKLTPAQEAAMQKLMADMQAKAVAKGKDVLLAEKRLEEYFAQGKSEDELREETYRVASLRAELRWVHLATHLAAKKILTAQQIATYAQMRHGEGMKAK
ncbi:MAG: Spy/CpxP family protein refolding chaperone, partial [Acidobacteria bacterium]|nr:Spy/CpxP family protein refolding chaperone [Acidobacteriota bacterium]